MATSMVDDQPGHFMFMFFEPGKTGRQIAFAGFASGRDLFEINHVYFSPGEQSVADEGQCQVFRHSGKISAVVCGAVVTHATWKRVAVVNFSIEANH